LYFITHHTGKKLKYKLYIKLYTFHITYSPLQLTNSPWVADISAHLEICHKFQYHYHKGSETIKTRCKWTAQP